MNNDNTYINKHINWYPGHMTAAKRMMTEVLPLIDIILELRDARLPFSSANPDIEKLSGNKPRLILLNKADAADPARTGMWVSYFRSQGLTAMPITATRSNTSPIFRQVELISADIIEKYKKKGVNKSVRALVAGIPNAGKSSLINSLCGSARTKTGDRPGVTRGKQWVTANSFLELLDTPGLLWPRFDDQTSALYLAFTGAINDDIFDKEELALELIKTLNRQYPDSLTKRYGITPGQNALEDFESICKKRGFILKGAQFDYARGAQIIIDEFRAGKLGRITLEVPNDRLD